MEWTLLERMNFGNQGLMMRLGLPLKACRNLPRETCLPSDLDTRVEEPYSSELAMTRVMSKATMRGTGRNLEVGHHGKILRKQPSQLHRKHIYCKTPTSSISSEHSKVLSPNRITQISPQPSGEMSWRTDRLILQCWSKTVSQESLLMMKLLTLATTSNF